MSDFTSARPGEESNGATTATAILLEAGLEPARITPYAPQAHASTNSATRALADILTQLHDLARDIFGRVVKEFDVSRMDDRRRKTVLRTDSEQHKAVGMDILCRDPRPLNANKPGNATVSGLIV